MRNGHDAISNAPPYANTGCTSRSAPVVERHHPTSTDDARLHVEANGRHAEQLMTARHRAEHGDHREEHEALVESDRRRKASASR